MDGQADVIRSVILELGSWEDRDRCCFNAIEFGFSILLGLLTQNGEASFQRETILTSFNVYSSPFDFVYETEYDRTFESDRMTTDSIVCRSVKRITMNSAFSKSTPAMSLVEASVWAGARIHSP